MTTIYKIIFTDAAGNETATGTEYKTKATATRAGNKLKKESEKPVTFRVIERGSAEAPKAKAKKKTQSAPAKVVPEKKAKDAQKYKPGVRAAEIKSGTVLAAIIDVVTKPLTRDEIITATLASKFAPPKSAAFGKDPKGYIRGYLSHAVSRGYLVTPDA